VKIFVGTYILTILDSGFLLKSSDKAVMISSSTFEIEYVNDLSELHHH